MRNYGIVLVTWVDAENSPGWDEHEVALKWIGDGGDNLCYAVGLLLRADDKWVAIVPNWNDDEYGDTMRIPAGNVIGVQSLKVWK